MQGLQTPQDYFRVFSHELANRILTSFPALYAANENPSPVLAQMSRQPFPAQTVAIMGVARRWEIARDANVVAECGTGKTLIALGSMLAHSNGRPFSAIVMAPPHLVEKWAREAFLTLPRIRVFMIDDMRNGGDPKQPHGVNEVRLRRGEIVREGLRTTLSDLRLMGRDGWRRMCPETTIFVIGRERAKLGYFWKHVYRRARSGKHLGHIVNADTGKPIATDGQFLYARDFDKKRLHEIVGPEKGGATRYSPLWEADRSKIHRMAPADYMSRYMYEWFDYAIADEIHQLAGGDTAQGYALGVLARVAKHVAGLTGTLLSGYADDLYNTLFRLDARRMVREGYAWGATGKERFTQHFGVLETIERTKPEDNACSKKSQKEITIKRKPGASPLLFGKFLMDSCAFVSLEDISDGLPPYREEVVSVPLAGPLQSAYEDLEGQITASLREHRGNKSVVSTMLNALLVYPDHPYGLGTLYGSRIDPETGERERFVIAETQDLDANKVYPKEQALIDEVKRQLERGRKCQIFAVYTTKYDVNTRLETLLRREGIRAAVLKASVPTHKREAWYREQLRHGIDVVICHPKLVETGLDLLDFPTILFHETGYSLHTLRQASRRSWRIGQRRPVEVRFFSYAKTMQEVCIRLMGKKLLVALAMEGKFACDGLQAIDGDDDILTAMARELVNNKGIGETANEVWRSLGKYLPVGTPQEEPVVQPVPQQDAPVPPPPPADFRPTEVPSALVAAATASRGKRTVSELQLSLF